MKLLTGLMASNFGNCVERNTNLYGLKAEIIAI